MAVLRMARDRTAILPATRLIRTTITTVCLQVRVPMHGVATTTSLLADVSCIPTSSADRPST